MTELTKRLNVHIAAINQLLAREINRQAEALDPQKREGYQAEAARCTTALDSASESLAYWIGRLLLAGQEAEGK